MSDQIDVNAIADTLNGKADTDLNNVNRNKLSGYDFTITQETVSAGMAYELQLTKTIDPKKYFVYAYAEVTRAISGFQVGDIIPLSDFWGDAYRNIGFWYNSTKVGFGTSTQVSCLPRGTTGGNQRMEGYIRVCFDFYKLRD